MKIFLAGYEFHRETVASLLKGWGPNILMTCYPWTSGKRKIETVKPYIEWAREHEKNLLIDSGLFSMMFGADKDRNWTAEDVVDYCKRYRDFLEEVDFPYFAFECDGQNLVGRETLFKCREILEPFGQRIIYIHHLSNTQEDIEAMADRYWMALSIPELKWRIGGVRRVKQFIMDYRSFLKGKGWDGWMHLLGDTDPRLLWPSPRMTCDSTTWCRGTRFGHGQIPIFLGSKMAKLQGMESFEKIREVIKPTHDEAIRFLETFWPSKKKLNLNHGYLDQALSGAVFWRGQQDAISVNDEIPTIKGAEEWQRRKSITPRG